MTAPTRGAGVSSLNGNDGQLHEPSLRGGDCHPRVDSDLTDCRARFHVVQKTAGHPPLLERRVPFTSERRPLYRHLHLTRERRQLSGSDEDRCPWADCLRELGDVLVVQPDAAVARAVPDAAWIVCAMDADDAIPGPISEGV